MLNLRLEEEGLSFPHVVEVTGLGGQAVRRN